MNEQQFPQERAYLKPHRGGIILALGILGLIVCQILGIIAWIMGNDDLREMEAGRMDPGGRDLTQAGKICGIIATCLLIIPIILLIAIFGFGAFFSTMK